MNDTTGDAAGTANAAWDTEAESCGGGGVAATQKFGIVADIGASEAPPTIMSSVTGVSGDISQIGWRISADAAQAAGAYTGTADYITTGTF